MSYHKRMTDIRTIEPPLLAIVNNGNDPKTHKHTNELYVNLHVCKLVEQVMHIIHFISIFVLFNATTYTR